MSQAKKDGERARTGDVVADRGQLVLDRSDFCVDDMCDTSEEGYVDAGLGRVGGKSSHAGEGLKRKTLSEGTRPGLSAGAAKSEV
jgi:hypothetical protein